MSYLGRTILNYTLIEKLGEGGFGSVFLGEHADLGRRTAFKILHLDVSRKPELVDRFNREARAACQVKHPAIIEILNFGTLETGEPYQQMEFFPGVDLSRLVRERGPIPLDRAAEIFGPIAEALEAAHQLGIVHRDLKPENIMVADRADGSWDVRLLDFGIAKLLDSSVDHASRTGMMMGTPTYMAPEQARDSKNVDPRADVYGFAATLYSTIAGAPPFSADNIPELIVAVQTQPPAPLRGYVPHASQRLELVIAACLRKRPDERPGTVGAAWQEIAAALRGGGSAPTVVNRAATAPPSSPTTLSSASIPVTTPLPAPPRRKRLAFAVVAVLAGAAIAAVALGASFGGGDGTQTAALEVDAGEIGRPISDSDTEDASVPTPTVPDTPQAQAIVDAGAATAAPDIPIEPDAAPRSEPEPEKPKPLCTSASFASLRSGKLSRRARRRGLARLSECRSAGAVSASFYSETVKRATPKPSEKEAGTTVTDSSCSTGSFARVYGKANPKASEVQSALARLRRCRREQKINEATFSTIQRSLIAKL